MAVTLERILTSPAAFALTTASAVQRACCRVSEGRPLGELADDENVQRAFGGPEAVLQLPQVPPKEFYIVSAIRCGKSLLTAAKATTIALTIDLKAAHIAPSEVARVSVVSLDIDKAKAVMGHLMGALTREGSALKRYLVTSPKPTQERILLRREDGRLVEIVVAAGKAGGGSLVSRWTIAAIFDEAARMLGKSDGVVNFDDMRKGVIARLGLLPTAQLLVVTSPWAARGPVYDAVQEYWGKPSEHLVVVRATGPEMCPVIWTPEACEAERLRPGGSYENDVLGEFVDAESGWLTASEVAKGTRSGPLELPPDETVSYTAAMDPATSGNAWTLVIVGRWPGETDDKTRYRVAFAKQWQGTPGQPLKAREVFSEMAPDLKRYGVTEVHTDRWGGSLLAEHGDYAGLTVTMAKDPAEEVARRHGDFRTLLVDGRLELAPHATLRADLLSTKRKRMPGGGVRFEYPLTRDGRHADFAPAVMLAVARAADTPDWIGAMKAWQKRGRNW